jgi:hypothetical protein
MMADYAELKARELLLRPDNIDEQIHLPLGRCRQGALDAIDEYIDQRLTLVAAEIRNSPLQAQVIRMRDAIDKLYNYDERTRVLVVQFYGVHHDPLIAEMKR